MQICREIERTEAKHYLALRAICWGAPSQGVRVLLCLRDGGCYEAGIATVGIMDVTNGTGNRH